MLRAFFGTEAWAQCVATKDCSTLGYKQSSCDSGKGIKCPFGEAWYCPCDASYIYTCTGTNESPSSAKCGDKYSMCNCATGTHWDSSSAAAWPIALHAQSAGFITVTAPVQRRPLIQPAKLYWALWYMSTITVSADKSWHRGRLIRMVIKPAATQRP